jgi:hypothetical protein
VDALGEVEELELAAAISDGCEGAGQFAEACAVDVRDFGEIQENLAGPIAGLVEDFVAKSGAGFAESNLAAKVKDGDCVYFARCHFQTHRKFSFTRKVIVCASGQFSEERESRLSERGGYRPVDPDTFSGRQSSMTPIIVTTL